MVIAFATPAFSKIIDAAPGAKWTYIAAGKTVVYGTPETDDALIRVHCPDGIDQLSYDFTYDVDPTPLKTLQKEKPSLPGEAPSGYLVVKIDNKNVFGGTTGELKPFEMGDELQGWTVRIQDTKWDFEKLLTRDGTATISTGAMYDEGKFVRSPVLQYKISLKGAKAAFSRLRSACK